MTNIIEAIRLAKQQKHEYPYLVEVSVPHDSNDKQVGRAEISQLVETLRAIAPLNEENTQDEWLIFNNGSSETKLHYRVHFKTKKWAAYFKLKFS